MLSEQVVEQKFLLSDQVCAGLKVLMRNLPQFINSLVNKHFVVPPDLHQHQPLLDISCHHFSVEVQHTAQLQETTLEALDGICYLRKVHRKIKVEACTLVSVAATKFFED